MLHISFEKIFFAIGALATIFGLYGLIAVTVF